MRPDTHGDQGDLDDLTKRARLDDEIVISQFRVLNTSRERLAQRLLEAVDGGTQRALFFANTNFVVKCRFLLETSPRIEVLLANDGVGMDLAAMLVHRRRFDHNLNGTDFVPFLFSRADRPLRVFLLGAAPAELARATAYARDQLGQLVVGSCDGFAGAADTATLTASINAARPDVVLVAMGNPVQENWIIDNAPALDARVFIGVGALLDFWAGGKSRAPALFRRLRLEWLYRLGLEPRRLARRYTLDVVVFLRQCLRYR